MDINLSKYVNNYTNKNNNRLPIINVYIKGEYKRLFAMNKLKQLLKLILNLGACVLDPD